MFQKYKMFQSTKRNEMRMVRTRGIMNNRRGNSQRQRQRQRQGQWLRQPDNDYNLSRLTEFSKSKHVVLGFVRDEEKRKGKESEDENKDENEKKEKEDEQTTSNMVENMFKMGKKTDRALEDIDKLLIDVNVLKTNGSGKLDEFISKINIQQFSMQASEDQSVYDGPCVDEKVDGEMFSIKTGEVVTLIAPTESDDFGDIWVKCLRITDVLEIHEFWVRIFNSESNTNFFHHHTASI
jgi:hypothetical protein